MYYHQHKLKKILGVPAEFMAHMPADFSMAAQVVDGVEVYVAPSNRGVDGRSQFGHRVRAICPHCRKDMSAGRYFQHAPTHGIKCTWGGWA